MKKFLLTLIGGLVLSSILFFSSHKQHSKKQIIGVVLPMEHESLNQIISGLKKELNLASNKNISLKVMNAQGDINIQRACIEQLIRDQCSVLVPIGTAASQMTLNLAKDQEVVCLAADLKLAHSKTKVRSTILDDNLSPAHSLHLIHTIYPKLKKITLIYSSSEKVAQEIPGVQEFALKKGIEVQSLLVHNMPDLYMISQAIASDSQAIFILKDHLVVSGIQTLIQQAERKKIPVISSDEGSVISGAAFAIGVKEAQIGEQGAQIVKNILEGCSSQDMAPTIIAGPYPVFINQKACLKQNVDLEKLIQSAKENNIPIEFVHQS